MKKHGLFLAAFVGITMKLFSQVGEAPNSANSAQLPSAAAQADKMMSNPVNLYTGCQIFPYLFIVTKAIAACPWV